MDEIGNMLGPVVPKTGQKVLELTKKKCTKKKAPVNREIATALECISITGKVQDPLIILKGKEVQAQWFNRDSPECQYTASPAGWTSDEIAVGWLEDIFIPRTDTRTARQNGRILVLDGHHSHMSAQFTDVCWRKKVCCVWLPPHTSHLLQPLDVACFSPLKSAYRQAIDTMATQDDAALADKQRFCGCYCQARKEALPSRNCRASFAATSIWLMDRQKGLRSDQYHVAIQRPITPPQQQIPDEVVENNRIFTPRNQRKFRDQWDDPTATSRDRRGIGVQTSALLAELQCEIARLRSENKRLRTQLAKAIRPDVRLAIKKKPNQHFFERMM